MNGPDRYLGQTLDEKYRLERLLGRGGMGAVYLATHLGTDRYVAVKLITPQLVDRDDSVERFRREARAAGRLRHPNIVDVTDFGFAQAGETRVAYLVMEYLDGCTLGQVLAEERRLPLHRVVDILEQVCSAVDEAHRQGVVHRDLKPDNIWLEPNSLGGFRAKVLDFGIAKLAETTGLSTETAPADVRPATKATIHLSPLDFEDPSEPELLTELPRRIQPSPPEATVRIGNDGLPVRPRSANPSTPQLTRAGAVLGTPWYMSPEQCRGDFQDARSDIYSLGVIAYQMLAGAPPFDGEAAAVIQAHLNNAPVPLSKQDRRLPRGVSRVVMAALDKYPAGRPQSAMAFAHALRANADDLGTLYRRAFALYCEQFPLTIRLSLLAHIPVIALALLTAGLALANPQLSEGQSSSLETGLSLLQGAASFLTSSIISGVTAILVTQAAVMPFRRLELRTAFASWRRRWWPFLKTGLRAGLLSAIGYVLLVVPGLVLTMRYALWAPVVVMEGLQGKAALKRSRELVSRAWGSILITVLFQILVPVAVQGLMHLRLGVDSGALGKVQAKAVSQLVSLTSIFLLPLVSIVPALLYLKMRQLGGETLTDVMAQVEDPAGRSRWEQRMRSRLRAPTPRQST
jgi:serine/threonine protein kinase